MVAGFSLGEVVAATVSGAFDSETGFRLVCKRGELMQSEAERFDTSMAAVVKLTPERVQEVCNKYSEVYPVNFNCPGQITVSGISSQMTDFFCRCQGGRRQSHSAESKRSFPFTFYESSSRVFCRRTGKGETKERSITLYSNMTAEVYTDDVVGLLSKQIAALCSGKRSSVI